jgi:hypothetical protein
MKPSLEVSGSTLCFRGDGIALNWSVEIKDIILIAEYTTNEGPYVDDYYIIFVTIENGKAYFASCMLYADGTTVALAELKERFGMLSEFGLLRSTEWVSRVMWPVHLAGSDYFQFTEVKPIGLWERISKMLFGPQLEYKPTDAIWAYIQLKKQGNESTAHLPHLAKSTNGEALASE